MAQDAVEKSTKAAVVVVEGDSEQHIAFSVIRNPANPSRVFIYRVSPGQHSLSYEQRAIQKGVSAPRWNKNPDAQRGVQSPILRADSTLVTLVYDDAVHVYGVATSNLVSLLSPFVELIEPKAICGQGKLAGCAYTEHDEEQAWLVYQGYDGPGNTAKPMLMYCDVTTPEAPDAPSTAKDIMDGTSLSLFHDTRRFWVIYQNEGGQLVAYSERDQKPSIISSDNSHFVKMTPIASCFIPAKDIIKARVPGFRSDALGRVIVYWVRSFNGRNRLYRAHADLTERSTSADFSEPRQATETGVSVEEHAQISVISNPETQSNYLFVAKLGGDNISSVVDDWAAPNESQYGLDTLNTELFQKWQSKILEDAILGRHYGHDHVGIPEKLPRHHHHNGYTNGFTNGHRLIEEDLMEEHTMDEEMSRRVSNGTRNLPLVLKNKDEAMKPQMHAGVITRTASSKWSEAEVQVVIPAGSTIMGDILVKLKVRPTD